MNFLGSTIRFLPFLLAVASAMAQQPAAVPPPSLRQQTAAQMKVPRDAMVLAATRAGRRLVAVGDHGAVLLSDDDGVSYRQAKVVPTRATLNSVHFVSDKLGWAAGHLGVILRTDDSGEHWSLQRDDLTVDQPLFSVMFFDQNNGLAAGLFSLLLSTADGGRTWNPIKLPPPAGGKRADANLFRIFADKQGVIFVAGEQGLVYRSADGGKTWDVLVSGNKGTFWTGIALDDHVIIVAGLRGKIFRSTDNGTSWTQVDSGTKSSITDLVQLSNGDIFATALDGVSLVSKDRGASFVSQQRQDQRALTAVAVNGQGKPVIFSQFGVVMDPAAPRTR